MHEEVGSYHIERHDVQDCARWLEEIASMAAKYPHLVKMYNELKEAYIVLNKKYEELLYETESKVPEIW